MWWSGGHQLAMSSVNTVNARSTGASTAIEVRTGVDEASGMGAPRLELDPVLEQVHRDTPEPVEVVASAVMPAGSTA